MEKKYDRLKKESPGDSILLGNSLNRTLEAPVTAFAK